jgi:hydroxyacylglutathione hydrolase
MRVVAPGVWHLTGFPRNLFNLYVVEDMLVDAGTRWSAGRVWSLVRKHGLKLLVLTHCHPDHQGSAAYLCERLNIPLACHPAEAPAMEGRARMEPDGLVMRVGIQLWAGPSRRVDRLLRPGEELAGFRVIETPGHAAGHISLYREKDGVVVAGDVLANTHFLTGKPGLRIPPPYFCIDPEANRQSALRLLDLKPRTICFGHGPVSSDRASFEAFANRLRGRSISSEPPA